MNKNGGSFEEIVKLSFIEKVKVNIKICLSVQKF